jgi:hypothetical protein
MKAKNVIESHYERIAIQSLRMPDPILAVMGGLDKQQAIEFLTSLGYTQQEISKL